ncbi:MAG: glycerophosphodiester phosphodiesterase family protein [Pseudomonadota bacterium]
MGHEPENTLSSVRKALVLGAPYVEVDVHYVDGQLVVFHNNRLERTTNGVGYLSEQSFEYLRSLDAGGGQRIPTLEEVCEVIDSQACLNIELRGPNTVAPVSELISNLIKSGWDKEAILVSSFNHRELLEMKRLSQDIKLGALIKGLLVDDAKFAEDLGAFSVHPSLDCVDQRFVDDAHTRGLQVYVYTVNHPDDIDKMYKLGVDGVFTDFPERVIETYAQGDIIG